MGLLSCFLFPSRYHHPLSRQINWDKVYAGIDWVNEIQWPELEDDSDTSSVIHHDMTESERPKLHKRLSDSIKSTASSRKERFVKRYKEWSEKRKIAKCIAEGFPDPAVAFADMQYHAENQNRGAPAAEIHRFLYTPAYSPPRWVTAYYVQEVKW